MNVNDMFYMSEFMYGHFMKKKLHFRGLRGCCRKLEMPQISGASISFKKMKLVGNEMDQWAWFIQ